MRLEAGFRFALHPVPVSIADFESNLALGWSGDRGVDSHATFANLVR